MSFLTHHKNLQNQSAGTGTISVILPAFEIILIVSIILNKNGKNHFARNVDLLCKGLYCSVSSFLVKRWLVLMEIKSR